MFTYRWYICNNKKFTGNGWRSCWDQPKHWIGLSVGTTHGGTMHHLMILLLTLFISQVFDMWDQFHYVYGIWAWLLDYTAGSCQWRSGPTGMELCRGSAYIVNPNVYKMDEWWMMVEILNRTKCICTTTGQVEEERWLPRVLVLWWI